MALFCYCSSSPFTLLRFPKQSSSSKSFVPKTLVFTKSVPMMSATSSESVASSISHPLLQRLYCCSSSSSSTEHDEAPSTRIFIKGLPQSTTEGNLKKAFSQFGEVNRVKILTDKKFRQSLGFAYLWFTSEESAKSAVKEMNGKFFEGRFVFVTTAKPGPSKSRVKTTPYKF